MNAIEANGKIQSLIKMNSVGLSGGPVVKIPTQGVQVHLRAGS